MAALLKLPVIKKCQQETKNIKKERKYKTELQEKKQNVTRKKLKQNYKCDKRNIVLGPNLLSKYSYSMLSTSAFMIEINVGINP